MTVPASVAGGERLAFLTSLFLHGGLLHLVGNLWTLWIFGPNVEERMGPWRFVVFYVLVGIVAGLAHVATDPHSLIPTIGASGAIAGVMGAYMLLYPRAQILFVIPILFYPLFFVWPAATYLLYWFALQFLSGAFSHVLRGAAGDGMATGGVAWWAHVGGFAAGMLTFRFFLRRPRAWALPAHYPTYLYRGH